MAVPPLPHRTQSVKPQYASAITTPPQTMMKYLTLVIIAVVLSGCLSPLQVQTTLPAERLEPLQAAYAEVAPAWFIVDQPSQSLTIATLASDLVNAGFKMQFPLGELFTAYLAQAQGQDAGKVQEGKLKTGNGTNR